MEHAITSAGTIRRTTPTANTTVYTHTGLAINTTHYYRVRAYNYVGQRYSNAAGTLTSWDTTTLTGAPVLINHTRLGNAIRSRLGRLGQH